MAGVANPERLWIDPESDPAQQAMQATQEASQKSQEMQLQIVQAQLEIEKLKIEQAQREADGKLQHAYYETEARMATEEAKITGTGIIELEKSRLSAQKTGTN